MYWKIKKKSFGQYDKIAAPVFNFMKYVSAGGETDYGFSHDKF